MHIDNHDGSVEHLVGLLQHSDPLVRIQAGFTLGSMGDEGLAAVPSLIGMLQRGSTQDRKLAATTLGQMGPCAAEAILPLLEAANDEDESVADIAAWALEEIDVADTEIDVDVEAA